VASSAPIRQLHRDRAELAALLERYETIVRQLRADLSHLEEAIRALDPSTDMGAPIKLRRRTRMAPVIFETLRAAECGCTARELAMHVMVARGIDTGNRKLSGEITRRVSGLLRHYRKHGVLRSRQSAGTYSLRWEIVPAGDGGLC
jgi:hypothetical protein